ncbi:MAG: hypothetical protein HY892_15385 [Deltaproteobacteria bacterium]|nr:hypothetical protein [Deltaproteobacteria bacterium]
MPILTLEPLRWQEDPSRITVWNGDSQPSVYFQVIRPRCVEDICCGRPVEELPRLVTLLGPSEHLTAALALDRLFQVAPPETAQNLRAALLQAQFCSAHLRKLYFLMTSCQDPLADFLSSGRGLRPPGPSKRVLEKIRHQAALAQEAEDILGGRHEQPLTAVTGGVSRDLKEGPYERLDAIGTSLLPAVQELAEFLRTEVLTDRGGAAPWSQIEIPPLSGLHLDPGGQALLNDPQGGGPQPISAERLGEDLARHREAWTYQPFVYLREKGWPGVVPAPGLFQVGPLARFNAGREAVTPLAEEERQRVRECLGAPPVYTLTAAIGALAVELIQAVEILGSLSSPEKLAGPVLRTIPRGHGDSTWAALETPQGLSWHGYQVNEEGIVQSVTVIDPRTSNNALKCLLAEQVVRGGLQKKEAPAAIKEKAAVALLLF